MTGKRLCMAVSAMLGASILLSGCSFTGAMERVVDLVTDSEADDSAASPEDVNETFAVYEIDESIAVPVFEVQAAARTAVTKDTPVALQMIATSPDGGLISYQWYRNNVQSNGGGTAISGATGDTYAPDTSEKGTWYYYVVAVNTVGGKVNMGTSTVSEISVWDNMYWQQNADNGGYQYICRDDGKYPAGISMTIDGKPYVFNEEGFVVDSEGRLIDIASGQPIITGPEEETIVPPVEETPAEEAPAEEAPAEEAPAEEAPAEEAPAEEPVQEAPAEEQYTEEQYTEDYYYDDGTGQEYYGEEYYYG